MKTSRNLDRERFVTLTLTNQCNLSCSYCYETNKNLDAMPLETALHILESELNLPDVDLVHLSLFGGEPFLRFDLIRSIVEYIECHSFSSQVIINATTNGTLVHGEIQDWLRMHRGLLVCSLSLDGTREMHNTNRSNSFDSIDVPFFSETYPDQPVKMTITPATLPSLFEGVVFCHNRGFRVFCNLAYGIDWSDEKNVTCLSEQLYHLANYYLDNPEIEPCTLLGDPFSQIAFDYHDPNIKMWCSAGTKMASYDTDGERYPCQMFMPLSCGPSKALAAKSIRFSESIPDILLDTKCRTCVAKRACPTCYGSSYIECENLYAKSDSYCKLIRTVLLARSYFMARRWKLGQLTLSDLEEAALLKSIMMIQEAFAGKTL